jgi:hypothetical protein
MQFKHHLRGILDDAGDAGQTAPAAETTQAPVTEVQKETAENLSSLPEFLKTIDPELQKDASLLNFKDINDLAKSYVHAKKFVGADKITLPGKYGKPEEWREVYKKLGLPESEEKYTLKVSEKSNLDKGFVDGIRKLAFENNILPGQAQTIVDYYDSMVSQYVEKSNTEAQKEAEDHYNNNVKQLQDEWGEAFKSNISAAKLAIEKLGDKDTVEHFKSLGIDNDARVLKLLAKAGKVLAGDQLPRDGISQGGPLAPDEALAKLDELRVSPAAMDENHPQHPHIIKEMEKLAQYAYTKTI